MSCWGKNMRGAKSLAGVLIASMLLSACAGSRTPNTEQSTFDKPKYDDITSSHADGANGEVSELDGPESYLVDKTTLATAQRADGYRQAQVHYHEEPTPEEQAIAETVLLLTASAFVCTFVVVVLDGACNFGVHAGYYY